MARTIVGVNDPKSVKRFAGLMAYDTSQKGYWSQRFMGKGEAAEVPIQILTDLESDAGEQIAYDLLAELKMAPVEGEDNLEGKEEAQRFYTDTIYIDQARCGVNTGGRMTRKRTLHNLREKAKRQQSGWWRAWWMNCCSSMRPALAVLTRISCCPWVTPAAPTTHWWRLTPITSCTVLN